MKFIGVINTVKSNIYLDTDRWIPEVVQVRIRIKFYKTFEDMLNF